MKNTLSKRLLRFLVITLVFEILAFLFFLVFSNMNAVMENEIKKLETPLHNAAEEFQRRLHNYRIWTTTAAMSVGDLLEQTAGEPNPERQITIMPALLKFMEESGATGVFLVFGDLNSRGEAIYLRDTKPNVSDGSYSDVMLQRGSGDVAKAFGIPVTSAWREGLSPEEMEMDFYRAPLKAAADKTPADIGNYGCFCGMFRLTDNDFMILTYSLPILSSDGMPLGVFGIELSEHHLKSLLPAKELPFATGSYLFARSDQGAGGFAVTDALFSGAYSDLYRKDSGSISFLPYTVCGRELHMLKASGSDTLIGVSGQVTLYQSGDYFVSRAPWYLIALVDKNSFYLAADNIRLTLCLWIGGVILLNMIAVIIIGTRIAKPVTDLSAELKRFHKDPAYAPNRTNIAELDELLEFFTGALTERMEQAVHPKENGSAVEADGAAIQKILPDYGSLTKDMLLRIFPKAGLLTERETEVLLFICKKQNNDDIAERLSISKSTVGKHITSIYAKLEIDSRRELFSRSDYAQSTAVLTVRESEVFSRLLRGDGEEAISRELMISVKTVRVHTYNICKKHGISSREELSAKFIRRDELQTERV